MAAYRAGLVGTSPRMRGKHLLKLHDDLSFRNIPAYAGKTNETSATIQVRWEHPRVCGENTAQCPPALAEKGTSPRMRGKPIACITRSVDTGNIPAYAGKTVINGTPKGIEAEHPRVCGENGAAAVFPITGHGTSPRMRGKRSPKCPMAKTRRNIPAYAGKT